jgi:tetratricopeptide (TPR) repeat protein
MYHYARGMAFAGKGKLEQARNELATLTKMQAEIASASARHNSPNAERVGRIMQHLLEAKIAAQTKDLKTATTFLREAVAVEDTLDYMEPPDWFAPARETLGGLLLQQGKAAEAEQVFRDDLKHNPNNPRSFFGLASALKAQGKKADAQAPGQAFASAWKKADTKLNVGSL